MNRLRKKRRASFWITFRLECRTWGLRVASDVEPLTGKRDGYRLIRKSASELAVRQTIPVANEVFLPYFLTQASYTSEAWNALMRNPHNRFEALRPVVEKLGGRIVNGFFAYGE